MRPIIYLSLSLSLFACADEATSDKPESDPDLVVAAAKADLVSDWYTTIRGTLPLGETLSESIDFPDYYLGRTLELRAGQTIRFDVSSNRKSIVRVYGPSFATIDGQPLFNKAVIKGETKKQGNRQVASLTLEAAADGTYMLLYGPSNVWFANYDITTICLSGCLPADACLADDACPGDEFCGWNGVACIRAPCDVAYDVCQARHDVGAGCDRDRQCAEGLSCKDGACAGGTIANGAACGLTSDCMNGFCGCADDACTSQICKPFAGEGETCGGFRMASQVSHCAPQHDCVAPYDIIADIPGHCGDMTTVAEVLANPSAFDGRYIGIKGFIDVGAVMCTKVGCSEENPCCNQCAANERLFDGADQVWTVSGLYLSEDGVDLGCAGNECNVMDHCAVPTGNAWVSGWFSLEDGVTPRLTIERRWAY